MSAKETGPGGGSEEGRSAKDGEEPERSDSPRIGPDGDERGGYPEDERADEAQVDRDERVQPGRADDRQRADAESDADEDGRHDAC